MSVTQMHLNNMLDAMTILLFVLLSLTLAFHIANRLSMPFRYALSATADVLVLLNKNIVLFKNTGLQKVMPPKNDVVEPAQEEDQIRPLPECDSDIFIRKYEQQHGSLDEPAFKRLRSNQTAVPGGDLKAFIESKKKSQADDEI